MKKQINLWVIALLLLITTLSHANQLPALQHASALTTPPQDISRYYVSEKLDGVRGYWNGYSLQTRQGHQIQTPKNYTQGWPPIALDGELWLGRNQFDFTSGCIRSSAIKPCWQNIRFYLFDLPEHGGEFSERVNAMRQLCRQLQHTTIRCVKQFKVANQQALISAFNQVIEQQGEGLMLHLESAKYQAKRVDHLLKLKPFDTETAMVVEHLPGNGKFQGMLGALKVQDASGKIFKIGSGFSNDERRSPPPIGSQIIYKYFGKTSRDMPRFASFIKVIESEK
ncbi:DNA ligase [Thalassotalea sp. LPB0316]|uniref:DNA ligase n=1 Tax=Thalassotalea sp. LPB0316 TaxID=2769490 RepID=UPI0018678E8A|nr:DNA ligase [Thalassotalea sp. LPB0316]QOL26621.1 DNA ligase [Thalassotalea sp. LPB0316]